MKLNYRFAIILIFVIFLSKEVLVFNEETLILFSFGLFVYLCYSFIGNTIYDQLNQYSIDIKQTFIHYDNIQKEVFLSLNSCYKNQKNLSSDINDIFSFTKNILSFLFDRYSFLLKRHVYSFVENIFKRLILFEKRLKYDIQQAVLSYMTSYLLMKFNSKNLDYRLYIKNSISYMKKTKK